MDELEILRQRIDETDRRLLETLAARLAHVAEVGRLKAKGGPFLRDAGQKLRLAARVAQERATLRFQAPHLGDVREARGQRLEEAAVRLVDALSQDLELVHGPSILPV